MARLADALKRITRNEKGRVMPSKTKPKKLTELEALIMDTVWDMGRATVRETQERLDGVKPMAYNTVLTMMRILRDKGFLKSERDGRMDVYRPCVTREQVGSWSLNEVLERFFAGSAGALVSQLLDSGNPSAKEIAAIRAEIDKKMREKKNGNKRNR